VGDARVANLFLMPPTNGADTALVNAGAGDLTGLC